MEDAVAVAVADRLSGLADELEPVADGELEVAGVFRDRLRGGNDLHDDAGDPDAVSLEPREPVNAGDAGVVEPGEELGLVLESADETGRGLVGVHDLDGDDGRLPRLPPFIDARKPPFPELPHESDPVDDRAEERGGGTRLGQRPRGVCVFAVVAG